MQVSVANTIGAFGGDVRTRPFPCEREDHGCRAFEWLCFGAYRGELRSAVLR